MRVDATGWGLMSNPFDRCVCVLSPRVCEKPGTAKVESGRVATQASILRQKVLQTELWSAICAPRRESATEIFTKGTRKERREGGLTAEADTNEPVASYADEDSSQAWISSTVSR